MHNGIKRRLAGLGFAFLISFHMTQYPVEEEIIKDKSWPLVIIGLCTTIAAYTIVAYIKAYIDIWIRKRIRKSDQNISPVQVKGASLQDYKGVEVPKAIIHVCNYLKDPSVYKEMNTAPAKGVLLYGDPGCGKSFLAYCVAGEITKTKGDCPFFALKGTDFIQPYVGQGKNVLVDLFKQAEQAARNSKSKAAIIFIDEIDSIGSRQSSSQNSISDLGVINELLVQMDGFDKKNDITIIVIAATNFAGRIDDALQRSGRFEPVCIENPGLQARIEIITAALLKNLTESTVTAKSLAEISEGLTPADITELFKATGKRAINHKRKSRNNSDFAQYFLDWYASKQKKQIATSKEKRDEINSLLATMSSVESVPFDELMEVTKSMSLPDVREVFSLALKTAQTRKKGIVSVDDVINGCALVELEKEEQRNRYTERVCRVLQVDKKLLALT